MMNRQYAKSLGKLTVAMGARSLDNSALLFCRFLFTMGALSVLIIKGSIIIAVAMGIVYACQLLRRQAIGAYILQHGGIIIITVNLDDVFTLSVKVGFKIHSGEFFTSCHTMAAQKVGTNWIIILLLALRPKENLFNVNFFTTIGAYVAYFHRFIPPFSIR